MKSLRVNEQFKNFDCHPPSDIHYVIVKYFIGDSFQYKRKKYSRELFLQPSYLRITAVSLATASNTMQPFVTTILPLLLIEITTKEIWMHFC